MILLDPSLRLVIAHRGASGNFPENTMLAFEQGLEQGADALELDVRASADGVPVVMHDAAVDRTTDGRGAVASFRAREFASLDAGRGEPVPLLDHVLERFPGTPLIVEIKDVAVREAVAEAVRRHDAADRVLVGSFYYRALRPFRRWHCAPSRPEIALFWGLSRLGLALPAPRFSAFAVPERHGRLRIVDEAFMRMATAKRKPVHVWTVNEPADVSRLRGLGVAGIITDYPARVLGAQGADVPM